VTGGGAGALFAAPLSNWLTNRLVIARTVFALMICAVAAYMLLR